jgi:hypothetical protein
LKEILLETLAEFSALLTFPPTEVFVLYFLKKAKTDRFQLGTYEFKLLEYFRKVSEKSFYY